MIAKPAQSGSDAAAKCNTADPAPSQGLPALSPALVLRRVRDVPEPQGTVLVWVDGLLETDYSVAAPL